MTKKPSLIRNAGLRLSYVALLAATAACAPTHETFLQDASSTCGNPNLVFPEQRTFETRDKASNITTVYDCVQGYLRASPEYQARMAGKENDAGYIDGLRRIDLARSSGQISADEAKAASLRLYQHYKASTAQ